MNTLICFVCHKPITAGVEYDTRHFVHDPDCSRSVDPEADCDQDCDMDCHADCCPVCNGSVPQ